MVSTAYDCSGVCEMLNTYNAPLDPFDGSYTWFEVGVGREGEVLPGTMEIQKNRRGKHVSEQLMVCC